MSVVDDKQNEQPNGNNSTNDANSVTTGGRTEEIVPKLENGVSLPLVDASNTEPDAQQTSVAETSENDMEFIDGLWQCKRGDEVLVFNTAIQSWVSKDEYDNSLRAAVEDEDNAMKEGEDEFAYQLRLEEKKKSAAVSGLQQQTTYTDPNDGTVYEWDFEKRAWLPKVDEDFIACYQASYGLNPLDTSVLEKEVEASTSAAIQQSIDPKELKRQKRKEQRMHQAQQEKRGWFEMEDSHNRNVYISGLPSDITMEEFEAVMSKCGIVEKELDGNKLKLKLYQDENGQMKGDGRCCYIKKESVDLALQILDGYQIRPGRSMTVERAQFSLKGDYDPTKRKKISAKQKKKMKEKQEKMLDWRPDKLKGERPKSDCTIVVKNLFDLKEFYGNATLVFDLQELLKSDLAKYGEIKKVMVFDNNPQGVASVSFSEPEMADDCQTMTDHRVMRGRTVRAERWDGKTNYKIEESEEERQKRIALWEQQLEDD